MAALRQEYQDLVATCWLISEASARTAGHKKRLWSADLAFMVTWRNTAVRPGGLSSHRTASRRDFRVCAPEGRRRFPSGTLATDRSSRTPKPQECSSSTWPSLKQ